jgi:hypothetical protein
MGMLDLLLGRKASAPRNSRAAPNSTQFLASQMTPAAGNVHAVRKDLLKLVLRETLLRNGIPAAWMSADMLRTTSAKRDQGLHVRFLVREWQPNLLLHGPALEQEFMHRLLLLDPLARDWLMGFSWQYALQDASRCPPLPHPGSWTRPPVVEEAPVAGPLTRPGDIIEGPAFIPRPLDEVRADLEQLLSLRDDDMKRHAQAGDTFAATRPANL